jgi:threonine dehydratase
VEGEPRRESPASRPAPEPRTAAELIAAADLAAAARALEGVTRLTPVLASEELSERAGTPILLKAECLQVTGSFKLRGVLAKVAALRERAAAGLITASAGNHARAVAHAARLRGLACEVFMPRGASVPKVAAIERLGARVNLGGASVEDALALAVDCAERTGGAFVHPFDDLDVIAGQGTLGLELLEQVPDLARVIVPIGGGGLASGIAIAMRQMRPQVELVGVQAAVCAPYVSALAANAAAEPNAAATIADGIAIKRPGELTMPLLRELVHDLRTVSEEEIADAMVLLAESAKLVAEGAGAVAVAALMSAKLGPVPGSTVAIVSGGNVDGGLLAGLLRRHETATGRRLRVFTHVPDRPGGLAELLNVVAGVGANLLSLEHLREGVPLHVRETGVELTLETRGREHTDLVLATLRGAGYDVRVE